MLIRLSRASHTRLRESNSCLLLSVLCLQSREVLCRGELAPAEFQAFFDGSDADAVVMNFGMLHLARPVRAMTQAGRVLKPGGWFAFTVWAKPEEAVGFGIILKAIQSHGNPGVRVAQPARSPAALARRPLGAG